MEINNVLYEDDDLYGFIEDIAQALEENKNLAIEAGDDDVSDLIEAISKAKSLCKKGNHFYRVRYDPMGAYYFQRMKIID